LIFQHPLEVDQAKGSARLLHMSLAHSQLLTGEVFAANEQPGKHDILLYPDEALAQARGLSQPPPLDAAVSQNQLIDFEAIRLIVLDGTWRKSRKMLFLKLWLQALPRLPLTGLSPSGYLIRKAHKPDQFSTLEAVCAALAQLEADTEKYQPLLKAFDGFVAQKNARRPE
jgi:DTW domain-containing protein YfiP